MLRHLLAREPDQPVAHDLLGNLLADAGRFAEARTHFAQAVQTGPAMAGTYYDLVRCRRLTEADTPSSQKSKPPSPPPTSSPKPASASTSRSAKPTTTWAIPHPRCAPSTRPTPSAAP